MRRAPWLLAALLAPAAARADAPVEATALFDQGIKDMQAGNLDAGCKELAASLARYPDSGTKGALAICYTRQGRVTSAWNLWKDLADTAPQPDDRADAAKNAAALEPRLPRFTVKLAAGVTAPAGLTVSVNGVAADVSLGVALPIDPGPVSATAHAPDHADWAQSYVATEGKQLAIEVPALPELPKAPPHAPPMVAGPGAPLVLREDHSGARHGRHVLGASLAGAGLAVAVVGAYFGVAASSKWSDAKTACNGDVAACQAAGLPTAQSDVSDARSSALISTIGFSVAGAAILTGVLVYVSAPEATERRAAAALRVTPLVSPQGAGLALGGRW